MFEKEIRVKYKKDIRYGLTDIAPEKTLAEITGLLRKHGCQKVGTLYSGDDLKIAFELDDMPFILEVPKVFLNNIYKPKIGIRIVFRYLETILELSKNRAVSIHNLFLPMAQIVDPEDNTIKPLGDVWIKNIAEGKTNPSRLLLEG